MSGTYGVRRDGSAVTEADIQAWADEAERGYDPKVLKRRGRPSLGGDGPSSVIPVRLDDRLGLAVKARAEVEQVSRSELIRRALRAYLDQQAG